MEILHQAIANAKEFFLGMFSVLTYYEFLVFGVLYIVFICVYFLGCLSMRARFFIPQFIKFIALIIFFAIPVLMYYYSSEYLYKTSVSYAINKPLEYAPAFFVDGVVTNIGHREIGKCIYVIEAYRNPKIPKNKILNFFFPLYTLKYEFKTSLKVGQSENFKHTFNHFKAKHYTTKIYCFGKK